MLHDPDLLRPEPLSLQQATTGPCVCRQYQTFQGRPGSVSCGVPGASDQKVLFEPFEHLWWVWGLILSAISPLLLSCWGFSFALGCVVSFFGGVQHSPVDGCSAASCNFGVLAGEENSLHPYQAPRSTGEGVPRLYSAHSLPPVSPVAGFPRTSSGRHSEMTASWNSLQWQERSQ